MNKRACLPKDPTVNFSLYTSHRGECAGTALQTKLDFSHANIYHKRLGERRGLEAVL